MMLALDADVAGHAALLLLTAEDLATRWQVSKAQVYRLARDGQIPTVSIGRYYRFRPEAIDAWEREREHGHRAGQP